MTPLEGKNDDQDKTFIWSKYTLYASVLRVALLFVGSAGHPLIQWIQSRAVQSILIDQTFTLGHVEEAVAVRGLIGPHQQSFADAYNGETIYLPPLLLAFLQPLLTLPPFVLGACLIVVDFWIARNLERFGRKVILERDYKWEDILLERMPSKILPPLSHLFASDGAFCVDLLPCFMAQIYYCSPIPLFCSSVLLCFQNLSVWLISTALVGASQGGSLIWSAFALAGAVYMNLHYAIFLVPMAILVRERQKSGSIILVVAFVVLSLALQGLSLLLVGELRYLGIAQLTHGRTFVLTGIAPSLSTLWYLGMELFDRFLVYMTILLACAPYLLIAPLWIRLRRYPETLVGIFWLLGTLFRPPATLFSLNVAWCLLLLAPRSLARAKPFPVLLALCGPIVPIVLFLVTYWLWLEPGSGEANFVFFQCLAYNVFVAILLVQFCSASLRRDKALRITEKRMGDTGGNNYE